MNQLPYEQQIDHFDQEIARLTRSREELIMQHMHEIRSIEAREAYALTEDAIFARYLATLGHDVADRGAVLHALMVECSTKDVTAFGYMCLAHGVCQQRFHDLQARYYKWRDGFLDGVVE